MEAKASSPAVALREKLSKARRPTEDSNAPSSPSPRRPSVDSASIKSKIKSKWNAGEGEDSDDSKISKLIPGRSKRKKEKRQKAEGLTLDSSEELRGRDAQPKTPTALATGESQSTLEGSDYSLTTANSEEDLSPNPSSARPALMSRDSHAGFATLSSPDIRVMPVPASAPPDQTGHPERGSLSHAATLPSPANSPATLPGDFASASQGQDQVSRASTLGAELNNGQGPSRKRSLSPLRLKEALKPGSSRKGSTADEGGGPSPSPGLGSFFSRGRSGSIASRRAQKTSDTPAVPTAIQTADQQEEQSKRPYPSIITDPGTPPPETPKAVSTPTAPATTVTPPTPVDGRDRRSSISGQSDTAARTTNRQNNSLQPSSNQLPGHRRAISDTTAHGPSKLSQASTPPLTPLEEVKTPGSTKASGNQIAFTGFFSSVISAAQNTANTITNTLGNNPARPRSATPLSQPGKEEQASSLPTPPETGKTTDAERQLSTIETIGSGNLSLTHLGLPNDTSMNSEHAIIDDSTRIDNSLARKRSRTLTKKDEAAAKEEGASAARAVSAAYDNKPGIVDGVTPVVEDTNPLARPSSLYARSIASDRTPPNGSVLDGESGLLRSGSVRSKTDRSRQRHRNSSISTAQIPVNVSQNGLSTVTSNTAPKGSGFAVATKRRNKDFHQLFKSVPEDDYLIDDYSCALQREILLAGRIYISESHICFSSNILGWVTTLVISFDEVVSVEKENTAMVIPNAVAIQTLHARHTIRSLLSRDTTYDLMIGIWKISHPGLQSSENGVRLVDGGTGSKTEKVNPESSEDGSVGSQANGEIYDEDDEGDEDAEGDEDDELESHPETRENSIADSDAATSPPKPPNSGKPAPLGVAIGQSAAGLPTMTDGKAAQKAVTIAANNVDFPGPVEHPATECADASTHYDKVLKDEVIPAPLGKVYAMVFGGLSGGFMGRWLVDEIKVTELQMEDDKKGLTEQNKSRTLSYIKPLNSSIGPKSTKCIITEHLDAFDLEKAVSVTVTTQTPSVPSGDAFSTKSRYCFMWGPNNGTRIIMSSAVEWTGKSWLKSAIEKGASDGQQTYANDLVKVLRAGVSSRPRGATTGSRKKGRKRRGDGPALAAPGTSGAAAATEEAHWGPLDALRPLLGPALEPVRPLLSRNSLIGFLVFLLIVSWFRNARPGRDAVTAGPRYKSLLGGGGGELREALYERMWREEEEALWDWLDARVGLPEHLLGAMKGSRDREAEAREARAPRVPVGLRDELRRGKSMGERELEWAIGVTEEKLQILRDSMKKGDKGGKSKVADPPEAVRSSTSEGAQASGDATKATGAAEDGRVNDEL